MSFANCILLTDATLLMLVELFDTDGYCSANISGTQVKKETLLQLIVDGKMQVNDFFEIVCSDAQWIRDELQAGGHGYRLVQSPTVRRSL